MNGTTNGTSTTEETISFFISVSISPILFFIFIAVLLAVLILSCVLRKKQPLKSRGITYSALLLLVLFGAVLAVIEAILNIFPLPLKTIKCYIDLYGIMPLIVAFVSTLIARNVRFLFVININKLKNVIFGNTKVSELLKEKQIVKKKKQTNRKSIFGPKRKSGVAIEESNSSTTTVETPTSPEIDATTNAEDSTAQGANVDSDETISNTDEVAQYFNAQVEHKALKRLRFLKFMTSDWITFAIVAIAVIIWYLFAVLYSIISFGNDPNCYLVSPGIAFSFCGVLYFISVGILLLDLLLHSRDVIQCRLHYLFCRHDKFLFHIEYLLIVVVNLVVVIHFILNVYVPEYHYWINRKYSFVGSIVTFLIAYATIFSLAGFILLVTIVWDCRARRSKQQNKQGESRSGSDQLLESVLRDATLQNWFREFCEQEWSLENFLCYQDITLWLYKAKQSTKLKTASQIYDKFIKPGCSLEINLPNYAREKARVAIQSINLLMIQREVDTASAMASIGSSHEINIQLMDISTATSSNREDYLQLVKMVEEVFILVQKEVKVNLNDTLYRFILTPNFQQHMDATELKDAILENG